MNSEPSSEPNVLQAVPFFRISDMKASFGFYVDGLGFQMKNQWIVDDRIRWCWLQNGGAALMLQEFAQAGPGSRVPEERLGVGDIDV